MRSAEYRPAVYFLALVLPSRDLGPSKDLKVLEYRVRRERTLMGRGNQAGGITHEQYHRGIDHYEKFRD